MAGFLVGVLAYALVAAVVHAPGGGGGGGGTVLRLGGLALGGFFRAVRPPSRPAPARPR